MTQRVRRKFTSSKFRVNNYLCKTFLEPVEEYDCGFYIWNIALAIGKSNRQLNDWYRMRKNKRARSLKSKLTGRDGLKALRKGYEQIMKMCKSECTATGNAQVNTAEAKKGQDN